MTTSVKVSNTFHIVLWMFLGICPTLTRADDAGDDYADNLFTDIAPLLALFGEQFARQFMSESMTWLDSFIFAVAPLDIITAMVGAIRVGGSAQMKALIGRARENISTAEIELMNSTSHEVGEVWNGHAIVRTLGTPQVRQIIFIRDMRKDNKTYGLYTLEEEKNQRDEDRMLITENMFPPP